MHFLVVHLEMTHCAAAILVMPHYSIEVLRNAQEADEVTSKLLQACSIPKPRLQGPEWNRPPLQHYPKLWSQLKIVEGVLLAIPTQYASWRIWCKVFSVP